MSASTRVVFVVQGEGRGHLSQALAFAQMLQSWNFQLVAVFVGRSHLRKLPGYFSSKIGAPIHEFSSPNFTPDKNNQGIKVAESLVKGALNLPRYLNISRKLVRDIHSAKPHVVVNFYEPLVGLSQLVWKLKVPLVSVGHQYMIYHPDFKMPEKPRFDRLGLKVLTFISQIGTHMRLALSFYPKTSVKRLKVVPPLLRNEVTQLQTSEQKHILIYVLNSGYAEEVMSWHQRHKDVVVHCFWDDYEKPNPYQPWENLHFHHLHDELFLEKMSECSVLLTTSGFESVCEAMYLGKPVAMVPVKGHYEQLLNSYDAIYAKAGIRNDAFKLDELFQKLETFETSSAQASATQNWFNRTEIEIKTAIDSLINK